MLKEAILQRLVSRVAAGAFKQQLVFLRESDKLQRQNLKESSLILWSKVLLGLTG